MELNQDNVARLVPGATVTETDEGVRIYQTNYLGADDRFPLLGNIMRAALSLGLRPEQIKDESEYEKGTDWGGMTGKDSDILTLDVTFLWPE